MFSHVIYHVGIRRTLGRELCGLHRGGLGCVECCKKVLERKLREIMGKIKKINQEWYIFAEVNIAKFAFYEV